MGRPANPHAREHSIQIRTPRYKYLAVERLARRHGISVKAVVRGAIDQAVWASDEEEYAEWKELADQGLTDNRFGWVDCDDIRKPKAWEKLMVGEDDVVATWEQFQALGLDPLP